MRFWHIVAWIKQIIFCRCIFKHIFWKYTLHWRHNDHDGISNHQPHGCLLNRLFRRRSKKILKLHVTGLCVGIHQDRWIPRTKGQLRRKCFHVINSSWKLYILMQIALDFVYNSPVGDKSIGSDNRTDLCDRNPPSLIPSYHKGLFMWMLIFFCFMQIKLLNKQELPVICDPIMLR